MKFRYILAAVLSVAVVGCGKQADEKAAGAKRTFAVIPKALNNPVFNVARTGAETAAKELGDVTINWIAPQTQDAAQQVSIVQNMISAKVDGIAISCIDAAALAEPINAAVKAGIPVVTWDSDAPTSNRTAFFGVDDLKAGAKMGEIMLKELPEGGDVAILTGALGSENLNKRIEGFKNSVKGTKINIVATIPCNDDSAKSVSIVRDYTKSHPNLKGWCMVGGWPLFTAFPGPFEGLQAGQVKVISFDTLEPELEYVRKGYVQALIGQKIFEWGHTSVQMLDGISKGKTYPKFVDSGMDIVTKDNVDAFVAKNAAK